MLLFLFCHVVFLSPPHVFIFALFCVIFCVCVRGRSCCWRMRSVKGCLKSETSSAWSWRSSPPVSSRSVRFCCTFLFPPLPAAFPLAETNPKNAARLEAFRETVQMNWSRVGGPFFPQNRFFYVNDQRLLDHFYILIDLKTSASIQFFRLKNSSDSVVWC